MKISIRRSFEKDSLKLSGFNQQKIAEIIEDINHAKSLSELTNCKKLTGYKNAYRIRIGDYRIGFFFTNNIVELVRVLPRKEMYRYFP
ncbi:MAG: type II toxin-antitoxin system RelE/ParE family toxin [Lacibacter sp.]